MLKAAAQNAHATLTSSFGDSQRGPKDVDPVSLADAAASVELFLNGRNADMLIDPARAGRRAGRSGARCPTSASGWSGAAAS
jgi:hypothetical protein